MAPSLTKWSFLLPLLLALAFHVNVLRNGFGWDDGMIVRGLTDNVSAAHVLKRYLPIFGESDSPKSLQTYFRPVISLSYVLDYKIWGRNPMGFHFSVWVFHGLNAVLVFLLTRRWVLAGQERGSALPGGRTRGSAPAKAGAPANSGRNALRPYIFLPLIAASLFAVHPIHAEAVAWIAGRNDVLCTTFLLSSFIAYGRWHRFGGWLPYTASMLFFGLALLSKETAVPMVLMFPLMDFSVLGTRFSVFGFGKKSEIPNPKSPTPNTDSLLTILLRSLPPLLLLALYFMLRFANLADPYVGGHPGLHTRASFTMEAIAATGLYFKLLIFPYPHRPYMAAVSTSSWSVSLSTLTLLLVGVGWGLALLRRNRVLGPALGWMLLTLAPAIVVVVSGVASAPVAERYLYAPSVGFVVLVAWAILLLWNRLRSTVFAARSLRVAGTAFLLAVFALGGWQSWIRSTTWRDPLTFWQTAIAAEPEAGYPVGQLGVQYEKRGMTKQAETLYRRAIALDQRTLGPDHPLLTINMLNLADLAFGQKQYAEAESLYRRAIAIRQKSMGPENPVLAESYNNLGVLFRTLGRYAESESLHRQALIIREKNLGPNHPAVATSLNNLAVLYQLQGNFGPAELNYRRSLDILERSGGKNDLNTIRTAKNLAELLRKLNREDEAERLESRISKGNDKEK